MKITVKDVEHVAALARLNLSDQEKKIYTGQFNVILEHIDRLNQLDLEGVEPTTYVQHLQNVFRSDREISSEKALLRAIMQASPDREDGLFKVPPVME